MRVVTVGPQHISKSLWDPWWEKSLKMLLFSGKLSSNLNKTNV